MAQPAPQPNRRRDKPVLSCLFCRGRKLRCDRQSPCSACISRGKATECVYTSSEQERKDAIDYRPRSHARNHQARQRLARLENLVVEMKDRSDRPEAIRDAGLAQGSPNNYTTTDGMEKLSLAENQAIYTGSSHWVTILEDIQHLKDELSEDSSSPADSINLSATDTLPVPLVSLLNSTPALSREQILAQMPSRRVVDRLISQFFNGFDMGPFFLHRNTFLTEYSTFWDDPSAAPITWVGLLFSVMSMSALLQRLDVGTLASQDMLETYRHHTIQCLIAGDWLRPSKYTIETLTLHFAVDQSLNLDASIGNWILIGVVIRLALRLGLHRDPSHWSNIRPLQAELRRRLWMTLYQMDFFTSTQVGLPRIIKDNQCDTKVPGHFFVQDIGVDAIQLPPERPLTDATPLLYVIERNKVIKVAAEIYDATEAGPPSPSTIAGLNAKLQSTIGAIPKWMVYQSLATSIADDPVTTQHQISLDILIHKATYLLHRRSFVQGSGGAETAVANNLCIQAALAILEHQRRISEETQPGGLMFGTRWKVATTLNHEFLQATMMLCFALSRLRNQQMVTTLPDIARRQDIIVQALTTAKPLWEKNADKSAEARRASRTIHAILQQEQGHDSSPPADAPSEWFLHSLSELTTQNFFNSSGFEQGMALDPSLLMVDSDDGTFGALLGGDFMTNQPYPNP